MEARFALSVRNAVLNVLRSRRRREPLSRAVGGTGVEAVPDRRRGGDDEILTAFLTFLKAEAGDDAVLAAINRLTRTDEWCGGRAWLAA